MNNIEDKNNHNLITENILICKKKKIIEKHIEPEDFLFFTSKTIFDLKTRTRISCFPKRRNKKIDLYFNRKSVIKEKLDFLHYLKMNIEHENIVKHLNSKNCDEQELHFKKVIFEIQK